MTTRPVNDCRAPAIISAAAKSPSVISRKRNKRPQAAVLGGEKIERLQPRRQSAKLLFAGALFFGQSRAGAQIIGGGFRNRARRGGCGAKRRQGDRQRGAHRIQGVGAPIGDEQRRGENKRGDKAQKIGGHRGGGESERRTRRRRGHFSRKCRCCFCRYIRAPRRNRAPRKSAGPPPLAPAPRCDRR